MNDLIWPKTLNRLTFRRKMTSPFLNRMIQLRFFDKYYPLNIYCLLRENNEWNINIPETTIFRKNDSPKITIHRKNDLKWPLIQSLFFDNYYPWRENDNYAVHIYHKRYRHQHSVSELLGLNNTVGELTRFTLDNYNQWSNQILNTTQREEFKLLLDEHKL